MPRFLIVLLALLLSVYGNSQSQIVSNDTTFSKKSDTELLVTTPVAIDYDAILQVISDIQNEIAMEDFKFRDITTKHDKVIAKMQAKLAVYMQLKTEADKLAIKPTPK